jgi:hypothetical protein
MRTIEAFGRAIGGILSPITGEGSLIRRARLFHPDGVVYRAEVRPLANAGAAAELARRISGPALARLSGAWWRHDKELPDLLGIALRFCETDRPTATPSPRDQDMLFASFRHIVTLPLGPLTTNVHDFLANDYHAVLPFYALGLGRVKFRLLPMRTRTASGSRRERLDTAVTMGLALLRLEVQKAKLGSPWQEVAVVDLAERALVDQDDLAFTPFRAGRGIMPVGLWQMARAATYAASQVGRKIVDGSS